MGEEEKTWTTTEAAKEWGVTPGRIRHYIYEGRIRAYWRGMWFIPKDQPRPKDLRLKRPDS